MQLMLRERTRLLLYVIQLGFFFFVILHLSLSQPREECDGAGYLNLRLITTGTLSHLQTHLSGLVCKQVSSFSGIPLLLGLIP